ncbi:flocculation protein FLO11 [Ceratina calcarata]|uniref:Flocculation protein FLO11 n=1 Tax=Ceratina calcarata TaxID=156304 RepID=A0AAJ7N7H7_9HYME|nr:flocculation protein FLO11 [Ceratina calcarata]
MYGRPGSSSNNSDNTQPPPPWLVRAEVTIRHGTPTTTESGQVPVGVSSTVTDSSGVRMIYRWNTTQSSPSPTVPVVTTSGPSSSSSSFGFQRGNILFTSTPPPRTTSGSYTIPRSSGSSANDESVSSRGRGMNISDSGYNSEQFSYSSLPSRRPSQQYNRRCRSTCSIVLSAVDTTDSSKKETSSRIASSENVKHTYDNSWRHHSSHQHVFSRHQFSTVPEVCEEEGSASSTHFSSRTEDKVTSKSTTISKDASSQTTDIESRESTSTVVSKSKVRKKTGTGLQPSYELKKKKQDNRTPSTTSEIASAAPLTQDTEKSDSSGKDDSAKRKSRTVHIDVYCTGSDDDENSDTSSENECDTPMTVFENPDLRVTHTQVLGDVLPRGFQDDKAFLKRATERRCDSFKNAPMRMPSIASSKGYDSDDVFSSLYPSQYSSYTALRDLDSAPWSAASSNTGIPFDYDSTIATSSKDTLSDIESLINSKLALTPCDSFEYASSTDRERVRKLEEMSKAKSGERQWRSAEIERKRMFREQKMKQKTEEKSEAVGWSSADSGDDTDGSSTVGWSFISSDETQRMVKKTESVRRTSKTTTEYPETITSMAEQELLKQKNSQNHSDSTTHSDTIPQPYASREQTGFFGSKSPSPLPSKVPSRVTSPFMTPQGERTDHILKASIFGKVVNAFRKPGHHIGPSKNPSCSCEHCRSHFEKESLRDRSSSISEFERYTGFRLLNRNKIARPIPK